MLDPFPPPPGWLRDLVEPWALSLNVPVISDHIHEILASFVGYLLIHLVVSPWLSARLFPQYYPNFNKRTKLNWDIHVVSFVQSTFINAVALWVIITDEERKSMSTGERVFGYTGSCALIEAFAVGYFIYDLYVSTVYVNMFGIGMLFHAICALWVFSFGFRPFVTFYSPVFILYELSSPFLNIHWFLDKVNKTGSSLQWYNGMALLFTFFCCRLVWGTWQSALVYMDMWAALQQTWSATAGSSSTIDITTQVFLPRAGAAAQTEISKYAQYTAGGVPAWLVLTYVISNLILNCLNYYWFSKMIETVMKRFRTPASDEKSNSKKEPEDLASQAVLDAAATLGEEEGSLFLGDDTTAASGVNAGTKEHLRQRKA